MGRIKFFRTRIICPPRPARQRSSGQIVPPLNGSITPAPEADRSNGRHDGVAADATVSTPSQEPSLVEGELSIEPHPQKVNGYTVTVNWIPQSPEEQQAIRAELAKIVAQSIVRLRREG
jgi:hypothetical protein